METKEERRTRLTRNTTNYRAKHPERVKAQRKRVYDKRKKRAMEMAGGCKCVNCGCDAMDFLEFNHINGGGCEEYKKNGNNIMDRILSGKRECGDIEVLCRICNALDHLKRKNQESAKGFKVTWAVLSNGR